MKSYIESHEHAIAEKTRGMADHFHQNVYMIINNQAKAMVVTKSIHSTMLYKEAFDRYLKENKSPFKAIVAFSGKKQYVKTGIECTEATMNHFPDGDNDISRQFK